MFRNILPQDSRSPLQAACEGGYIGIVKLLIQSNANIELKNKVGVVLLIIHNAFVILHLQEGRTALMIACWKGHLPIVMEMIRTGAKTDIQDQVCVCVCVCTYPQNDDSQSMCTCVCGVQEGLTSLMLAAQNGYAEIVEALLNANANPNITENVNIE